MAVITTDTYRQAQDTQGECQPNGGIHMLVDYREPGERKVVKRCLRCRSIIEQPKHKK